ncbi:calphotin-like [Salmo salar]|uniref:Calphotin-like n=1 Tax=Salmo salar TaxID=8030 RepID=A0ABM3ECF7_SALSA|nr:calphotin-like [Salmo salar]
MVLSVTISTGRVSATQVLKDLSVRRGSVPRACTDSSVTSTAPVMPPTLSAVTPCQVSAPVQQDGRGSTATRPVHLVTTATDAGCHAAVPTGLTVTESLGPASVPLVTWVMTALLCVLRGSTVLVAPLPAPVITTLPAPPSMDPVAAEKAGREWSALLCAPVVAGVWAVIRAVGVPTAQPVTPWMVSVPAPQAGEGSTASYPVLMECTVWSVVGVVTVVMVMAVTTSPDSVAASLDGQVSGVTVCVLRGCGVQTAPSLVPVRIEDRAHLRTAPVSVPRGTEGPPARESVLLGSMGTAVARHVHSVSTALARAIM